MNDDAKDILISDLNNELDSALRREEERGTMKEFWSGAADFAWTVAAIAFLAWAIWSGELS